MERNITIKYMRPTVKEYGHFNVLLNGEVIGYFMLDKSPATAVNDNWFFETKRPDIIKGFAKRTKKEVMPEIEKRLS